MCERMCVDLSGLACRAADTTKQALGILQIHFVNLALAVIFKDKECVS